MDDNAVLKQIQELVDEEHHLLDRRSKGELEGDGHTRLGEVEIRLDQCWDLLRQRRAMRSVGEDPSHAQVRDATTVERYQQ